MSSFNIDEHTLRWSGLIDPQSDVKVSLEVPDTQAGFAELRAALDGDVSAGDQAVRLVPMPLTMLHDLAARCLNADREAALDMAAGRGAPDARWARALAAMAGPQKKSGRPRETQVVLYQPKEDRRVTRLRAFDGALAVLADTVRHSESEPNYTLAIGDAKRWHTSEFATARQVEVALPLPLLAANDALWVTTREPSGAVVLDTYSPDGTRQSSVRGVAPSAVQHVSVCGKFHWLHCEQHHQLFNYGVTVQHADNWRRPLLVGTWLLSFGPRHFDQARREHIASHLTWTSLDRSARDVTFSWNETVFSAAVTPRFAIVGTASGAFLIEPGGQGARFAEGPCYGLASDGTHFAIVTGHTVRLFDLTSREETASFALDANAYHLTLTPGCVVASSFTQVWVFSRVTGACVFSEMERREPTVQQLANGHTVVSAGELVAAFDTKGALLGSSTLPYDGQLVGATATHAIYGPVSGGIPRTAPDGLHAIDAQGQVASALRFEGSNFVPRPVRQRYGGGTETDGGLIFDDRMLVVNPSGALLEWKPSTAAARVLVEVKRLPVAKGVTETRFHTTNPRDDWPMPGVEVQGATFLAHDCTWRGTTGVAHDVAARVRNGAVATFVRCKLSGDGGGIDAGQGSTVVLHGCDLDRKDIKLGPGCHLLFL